MALLMVAALIMSCSDEVTGSSGGGESAADVAPFTEGIRIGWDYRTRQRLFDGPASYPRMIRLQSGNLICSVESAGDSYVVISEDEGGTWSAPIEAASSSGGIIAAVPSLLQLESGRILLAYNTRPPMDNMNASRHFGIKIASSTDGGWTWTPWADVFEGGHTWDRGVWEPSMIQLDSGEVLLYFANEYPYAASNDQKISLVRSQDNGRTWSAPETVSYRQGHRDGMPVPLQLQNGKDMVVAIEDDGLVPGPFKPVIVRLPADGSLEGGYVDGKSPRREAALAEASRLPVSTYGGAPYLAQLTSGETLLSFQSNEGRPGDWANSTMVVTLGDEDARSFDRKSYPFPVPEGRRALWNALFVKDENTVTALSSTNAFDASRQELYIIDGGRIRAPVVYRGTATVDGDASEGVWEQSTNIFVGAYSDKVADVRAAWDEERLYVLFNVTEGQVVDSERLSVSDDAVLLALAPGLITENRPTQGVYRLRMEADGRLQFYEGHAGTWEEALAHDIEVAASEATATTSGTFAGQHYLVEVGLPWERVGGRPATGQPWGLDVGLVNRDARGGLTREWVAGTRAERPTTWLKAVLEE